MVVVLLFDPPGVVNVVVMPLKLPYFVLTTRPVLDIMAAELAVSRHHWSVMIDPRLR